MTWVRWPDRPLARADVGGKAFALAALVQAGFDVPGFFAIASGAESSDRGVLAEAIAAAVQRLAADGARLAVRSSAVDEDGTGHSFAGQLESYLDVSAGDVVARVEDVWRSGRSARVDAYRRERGLDGTPTSPAVIVQRMLSPEAAGVAFSADPVRGRRSVALVAAVPGLGDRLVSGEADADQYEVSRDGTVTVASLREGATDPVLQAPEIAAVARLAREAARHFGRAQDIEWAIERGRLHLLQSRPVTTLAGLADPDGGRRIWDNSNIAESYGGITTPLTFSFARTVYAEVYRQFCVMMAVPRAVVDDHRSTFDNMLGLVRGRVYYNLISWYRVLAMLPGFSVNRTFMEQMMGVREPMPDEVLADLTPASRAERWKDGLRLARALVGLGVALTKLPRQIARFYDRLETALGAPAPLAELRLDELAAHYRTLERQLLTRWDAPLVNDFFAMIFYGVLRTLCVKWVGDASGSLQNDLLTGEGGIISAEPARLVQELARIASSDAAFTRALVEAPLADVRAAIVTPGHEAFRAAYDAYLAKFSDRCLDELKLESPTLADDPLMLLRSIGRLAQTSRDREAAGATPARPAEAGAGSAARRLAAEARVASALSARPIRRAVFTRVLRQARTRVQSRENLRFERTRVFGRVRRIFVEAGRRLAADDRLDVPDDVFYLEVAEVLGLVEGTVSAANLGPIARARRAEFDRYRGEDAPADRFETRGAVWVGNRFTASRPPVTLSDDERRGIGCCPGVVEGRARVITDPRGAELTPGDILVAERTDPGWILLFPAASAVVVERGSVLSHSAIVARELGLPAVVSLPGLTSWLKDGDHIAVDGTNGIVRRLAVAGAART